MRKLSPVKAIAHAFNSVATYAGAAVRIGMFWIPVVFVLNVAELLVGPPDPKAITIGAPVLVQLLSAVVGLIGFSSMAVAWHRFILRDEMGPPWRLDASVLRYAGNSLLIMLSMVIPGVIGLVMAMVVPLAGILLLPLVLAAGVIITRLSIKLPAVALGRTDFTFRQAWSASEGNNWQIMGVFALNAAITFAIILLMVLILQAINSISAPAAMVGALVVNAVAGLFLTVFNASIFTSLYGFFVERRDF